MENITTQKFDPEEHKGNAYEAFCEFVEVFTYEYAAIKKDPPKDMQPAEKATWKDQKKKNMFLGKFASRNLQKNFEIAVPENEREDITYDDMIKKLKLYYEGGRNKTLANYEFHKLTQTSSQSFDAYVTLVKREASKCDFACASNTCNVRDTLVRDQIIIGTSNDEIRKNSLKNQWGLEDLIKNGRALEAASRGAKQIKDEQEPSVARIKKPGKYSRKFKKKTATQPTLTSKTKPGERTSCTTCSNRNCRGGKHCLAQEQKIECFECGKEGHFKGAAACKGKKKAARKVNTHSSSSEEDSSEDEQSIPESSSDESSSERKGKTRRVAKHVTRIRRMRRKTKHVRKTTQAPRYEVDVVINGEVTKAFADTGADIPVMSKACAKKLGLKLCNSKMKIHPYGSKPVKCKHCYIGTIMHGDHVANVCIYIVKQDVEFLLSGRICEELGIIEFNPKPVRRATSAAGPFKSELISRFPKVFADKVGRMKDYQVKLYVDESVPPVAERRRPVPFHLREKRNKELDKMEAEGLIEEHEGPAPWISNTVLTPKDDGSTRVTVDMRNVNKAILPTNISIPRVEDIKS